MQPRNEQGGQKRRSFIEEARRSQIVDAAIEVTADVGYPQASMARIAAHAGISRGLISYHFANKAELIAEVIATVYIDGAMFMGPSIEAAEDETQRLRAYITSNLEYMRAYPDRMVALVEIFTKAGREELPNLASEDADAALAPLEEMFRAGQAAGEFRDFHVRTMAHAVRDVIDGAAARTTAADFDLDACIEEVTTMFDRATAVGHATAADQGEKV